MKRRTVLQTLSAFGAWILGLFTSFNPRKAKAQLAPAPKVSPEVPWVRVDPPLPTVVRFERETQEGLNVMRLTKPAVNLRQNVKIEWERVLTKEEQDRQREEVLGYGFPES